MSASSRRLFFKRLLLWAASLWVAKPSHAVWQATYFKAGPYQHTLMQILGEQALQTSDLLSLTLPEVAENGAVVPFTLSSPLTTIRRIYLLVEKNPTPLAAEFMLTPTVKVQLSGRIKMAESCEVVAIAETDSGFISQRQWVKVMLGGCGTG